MSLPEKTLAKLINRFDELLNEGEEILKQGQDVPPAHARNDVTGRQYVTRKGFKRIDFGSFSEWRMKVATILMHVLPAGHVHAKSAEALGPLTNSDSNVVYILSMLRAVKSDLKAGFFDTLSSHIEAAI